MNGEVLPFNYQAPGNVEAEQALLGACLVNNEAFHVVDITPEKFSEPIHGQIWRVMGDLITQGRRADPITIKAHFDGVMVGDMTISQYLARVMVNAVTVINAPDYARAVKFEHCRKEAEDLAKQITKTTRAAEPASDAVFLDELDALRQRFDDIMQGLTGGAASEERAGDAYMNELQAIIDRGEPIGVPWPFPEFETVLSEPVMEKGNLYGLVAASGEGKTSIALQVIHNALKAGHPVQFLSFDQSQQQCVRQIAAQTLEIGAWRQRNAAHDLNRQEVDQLMSFAADFNKYPFDFIKCSPGKGAEQIALYSRPFLNRHKGGKVPLIVLDHTRKVSPHNDRTHEGRIAGHNNQIFKNVAGEGGCVYLALNQRNSFGMRRKNPRPIIDDLFGGEQGREDYDAIAALFRPEWHLHKRLRIAETADEREELTRQIDQVQGKAELSALKVRHGAPDIDEQLKWVGRYTRLESMRPERGMI